MIYPLDFAALREIVRQGSGLALRDDQEYLVESRLTPLAAGLGYSSLEGLLQALRKGADQRTKRLVCEALATHETLFFRDGAPFKFFTEKALPAVMENRKPLRRIRIWCAGVSSGQEAYSIAMSLLGLKDQLSDWTIEIIGTDYSEGALARAREGVYNHFEVQRGLPATLLIQHFEPVDGGWRVKDHLRQNISFRYQNLLEPFSTLGVFDFVFCRNVLIYFDLDTKRDVLNRLSQSIPRHGFLFLGGAESALGIAKQLVPVEGAGANVYRLR